MVYSLQSVFTEKKQIEILVVQSCEYEIVGSHEPTLLKNETSKTPVTLYELKRSFSASSLMPELSICQFLHKRVPTEYVSLFQHYRNFSVTKFVMNLPILI